MERIKWAASGLVKGDRVLTNLAYNSGSTPQYVEYVEDTPSGIVLKTHWRKPTLSRDDKWDYNVFVSWSSIYCGHVKIKVEGGDYVKAVKLSKEYRIGNDMKLYPLVGGER